MTTDLSTYLGEIRSEQGRWLGQIVMWSLSADARVKVDDLHLAMEQAGLNEFAPKPPRISNTFRSVSSKHARKGVETDTPGVYENYKIEEVKRGDRRVVKDIVVQRVNQNDEQLSYDIQVRLEYVTENNDLRYWWIGNGEENQQALNLADLIAIDFRAAIETYNSNIVRGVLRKILDASFATSIYNKGYFVSNNFTHRVAGLEMLSALIEEINVTAIPLNDSAKQRDMLKQAYESTTVGRIASVLVDIDQFMKEGVTEEQIAHLLVQKDELTQRTQEYSSLLETSLRQSHIYLDLFEQRVQALIPRIKRSKD